MIPEALARLLANIPAELVSDLVGLIEKAISSPDPKAAIARAAQVLAHEKASDAAVDAMFAARNRIAGTGE